MPFMTQEVHSVTFGDWIKQNRKAAKMSLDELAEASNFSKTYINRIERNLGNPTTGTPYQPSKDFVDAIATAMGVNISDARRAAGYTYDPPALPDGFPLHAAQSVTISEGGKDYEVDAEGKVIDASPATKADIARVEAQIAALMQLLGTKRSE